MPVKKHLTYRFSEQILETLLTKLMANDVREKTLYIIEDCIAQSEAFFYELENASHTNDGSDKRRLKRHLRLSRSGRQLLKLISAFRRRARLRK